MSLTEMIAEVGRLTPEERKELRAVLEEAERQDRERAAQEGDGEKPKSFAEAAAHLIGSIKSGLPSDLSTNKKYMEGFGRD
jgi:uncharacterized membrane protein